MKRLNFILKCYKWSRSTEIIILGMCFWAISNSGDFFLMLHFSFWSRAGVMFVWIAFPACSQYQMAHILFLEWHSSFLFMSVHILGCLFAWFAFQVCALFRSWLGLELTVQHCLPHGVEDSSVLHDAEQLVGGGHVVRDRPLAIPEKGVGRPDLADH